MSALLADLTFLRPLALWLFVALPVVYLRMQSQPVAGKNPWSAVIDDSLMPALFPQGAAQGPAGFRPRRRTLAACLVWSLCTLALSGPSLHTAEVPTLTPRSESVIALGLSPSMLAEDLTPDRLTRSRIAIEEWLRAHEGEEIGLVAFAGSAFRVSPLTRDTETLIHLLTTLRPDVMPRAGSDISSAAQSAASLFSDSAGPRTLLLVTDAAINVPEQEALAALTADGVRVQVIGVGTPSGAPIPLANGRFATGRNGQLQLASVNLRGQQRAVESIGGTWMDVRRFDARLGGMRPSAGEEARENAKVRSTVAQDDGIWLLFPLILIVAMSFRRGSLWVVLLALSPWLMPPPATAAEPPEWLLNREQRALKAWRENPSPETAQAIPDASWRGAAEFLGGDFAGAENSFTRSTSLADQYNRALSLAHQDRVDEAITGFRQLLEQQPDYAPAQHNLEVLEKVKEQQPKEQDGEGEQNGESGENQDDAQEGDSSESQPGSEAQDGSQSSDASSESGSPQTGESTQSDDDPSASDNPDPAEQETDDAKDKADAQQAAEADENAEADAAQSASLTANPAEQEEAERTLRQWLRRVDSDPSRLLRERFRRLELERQRGAKAND